MLQKCCCKIQMSKTKYQGLLRRSIPLAQGTQIHQKTWTWNMLPVFKLWIDVNPTSDHVRISNLHMYSIFIRCTPPGVGHILLFALFEATRLTSQRIPSKWVGRSSEVPVIGYDIRRGSIVLTTVATALIRQAVKTPYSPYVGAMGAKGPRNQTSIGM